MKKIPITKNFSLIKSGLLTALLTLLAFGGYAYTVTINLKDYLGGSTIDGTPAWYNGSGGWHTLSATSGGTITVDLAAGSYLFSMNYNNYTQQTSWTAVTSGGPNVVNFQTTLVTTSLMDHTGISGLSGGTPQYYTGSGPWHAIGSGTTDGSGTNLNVQLLPGSYLFSMNYNNYTQQTGWSAVNSGGGMQTILFQTTLVTTSLKNHDNTSGLSGGTPKFYTGTGAWQSIGTGTTDITGINMNVELLPGNYLFSMNYNNYTQQTGWTPVNSGGGSQTISFQTTLVTSSLKNHDNSSGLSGGTPQYYTGTGSWQSIGSGTTDASGTNLNVELLPGNYLFNMNYNYYTQQTGWTAVSPGGGTQTIPFQTRLVTTSLMDHTGSNGLSGGVAQFYTGTGTWHTIGTTTDASGTNLNVELLSGNYLFNMNYNYQTQQTGWTTITTASTQTVPFQTTLVSSNLKTCEGMLINTTAASSNFYTGSGTWHSFAAISNGTTCAELLPGNYLFNMTFNYQTQQTGWTAIGAGPTQPVNFNTTKVTFSNPNASTVSYYTGSGTWHVFTPNTMEMLPGNYLFQTTTGGPTTPWTAISGCTKTFYIAPCTTLAITALNDGGCGGSFPLSAPAGGSIYSWTGPGGFTASTRTIEPTVAGLYSVNVTYDFTCSGAAGGTSGYSYNVVGTASPNTVTVRLQDSKGNPISGATAGYYSGGWVNTTTNSDGFACFHFASAGSYSFHVVYAGGSIQWDGVSTSGNPVKIAQTTCVTARLVNSTNSLIVSPTDAGTTVQYYSGGWINIGGGTTGTTGTVSTELLPGSYPFHMTYAHATYQLPLSVSIGAGPNQNVDFITTAVTASLKANGGSGAGLSSGVAQYYSGGWYDMGTTGANGVTPCMELFPMSYPFHMTYAHATYQLPASMPVSGTSTNIAFNTITVSASLKSHGGTAPTAGLSGGAVQYYSGGWWDLGTNPTTDGSGNTGTAELLPMAYPFHITYAHATYQWPSSINVATTPVAFTTSTVNASLLANGGSGGPESGGTAQYYSGGWWDLGLSPTTDGTGYTGTMELLPMSYPFHMTYAHATYQLPLSQSVSGSSTTIPFTTTTVQSTLVDHTGSNGLPSGTVQYYSGGWWDLGSSPSTDYSGTTGTMELLPGSYAFHMTYAHATYQLPSYQGVPSNNSVYNVPFQTALVTIQFKGHSGAPIDGATIGYYSGGWWNFPNTTANDGLVDGVSSLELLPVAYTFNATKTGYGTTQSPGFSAETAGAALDPTHVIQHPTMGKHSLPGATTASGQQGFGIYPNPASDKVTINFTSDNNSQATLQVADMSGKVLMNEVIDATQGSNSHDVNLGNLASGMYLIMFSNEGENEVSKISVQH